MTITLYNSLSGKKQEFVPLDENNVRMYVCGPTVYDYPHIGNARAVVVYDILYRVLCDSYGKDKVNYVRNITDIDDKINAQAKRNNEPIFKLSQRVTNWFHDDMEALNNLPPTHEPRATEHIADIIELIENIITNGHAYVSRNHVLFDVNSIGKSGGYYYGKLSGKITEDLIAGSRVEIEDYKKNAGDFVLWKPSLEDEPGWNSAWGRGRPGWHIECSAMSIKYLGADFDIHGGGADLKFPHHENEIAQGCCGYKGSNFASYWVHNGFVTVNGEKMAKSAGNFVTVRELLDKGIKGEVIRYALLATHYRKPLDFSDKLIEDAGKNMDMFYRALQIARENIKDNPPPELNKNLKKRSDEAFASLKQALRDDMNTPRALAELYVMAKGVRSLHADGDMVKQFREAGNLMGLLEMPVEQWFAVDTSGLDIEKVNSLIEKRAQAKSGRNWDEADRIRNELLEMGIELQDGNEGTTWHKK